MGKIEPEKATTGEKASWWLLALLFLYMLALNMLMPLHRDDYWYSLVWGTFDKVSSWSDVFLSLYNHYFDHGGRMVAYFVLDSFLFLGKGWFNPFNAFLFVALVVLMYWYSQRKISLRFNPYILTVIILFAWLGFPHFAEVNLWMAGATGYLFTAVVILTFLLPYYFCFLGTNLWRNHAAAALVMFGGGILAGWSIENTAATATFATAIFAFYFYRRRELQLWMATGFVGALTGFVLLVAAPGNFVRAAEQQAGSKLYHVTNLFAAGAETLLYVFPIIIFLVMAKRILLTDYSRQQGMQVADWQGFDRHFKISSAVTIGVILFLLVSYLQGNSFSQWLSDVLYNNVAVRFGIATAKLKEQSANTLSGLEEMVIYLLTLTQLFRYGFTRLSLGKTKLQSVMKQVSWRELMAAYPVAVYAAAWIGVALFNHFVMIASPRFPARAAFGSVVCLIISAASVFTIPTIYNYFLATARKKYLTLFAAIVMLPMAAATLYQYTIIYHEDSRRMAYVAQMANQGVKQVEVEAISSKNRVLRHVYFVDLYNAVSKTYLANYYGLKDIKLKDRP